MSISINTSRGASYHPTSVQEIDGRTVLVPFTQLWADNLSASNDSFGRFRMSQPLTLFASKQLFDSSPLFFDQETNGTGAGAFQSGESRTDMTTAADGDWVVRQSKQRLDYQPGKSQRIFCTFTASQETNVVKRIGYFSSSTTTPFTANRDGIYLEVTEDNAYLCVFKNGTESARVQKSDWSADPDIDIDWTKSQILVMDFEWLGVGGVRFGFVIDGVIRMVHRYNHSNRSAGVYMQYPNQPIRYEIRQTGAGSGTLSHICSEVESEGGQEELGVRASAGNNTTAVSMANNSNIYPLLGIRLKSTHLQTTILPRNASFISTQNDNLIIYICINPTLTATPSWTAISNASTEEAINPGGTVTDLGVVISEVYVSSASALSAGLDSALKIGATIAGVRDEYWIVAQSFTNNANAAATINWTEL